MDNFYFALALTIFAGLSTGIGSAIAFFAYRTNYRFLSIATGFSAGVMLYVSFVEILPDAAEHLAMNNSPHYGQILATISFFGGIILMLLVDRLVPQAENPHELRGYSQIQAVHQGKDPKQLLHMNRAQLHRMGVFTAIAIAIHNFPEGIATLFATISNPALGIAIAVAVALHNIPEGVSISVPIYFATGNRRKAFMLSLLSGLAEPVGAVIAYAALHQFLSPGLLGVMFGVVAGIMIYISLDELLPTSHAYGRGHDSLYGLISGMAVMAVSLLIIK